MTEQQSEQQGDQVIQIEDRVYKVSDLSEESRYHVMNLQSIQNQIAFYKATVGCIEHTSNSVMALLKETVKDTPSTEAPKAEESAASE